MLLAVTRQGNKPKRKYISPQLSIWDTSTMRIEEEIVWQLYRKHTSGVLHVENFEKALQIDIESQEYNVCNTNLFPIDNPVFLGCGDIWYGNFVWNAFTGYCFEVKHSVSEIIVGDGYYMFNFGFSWSEMMALTLRYESGYSYVDMYKGDGIEMSQEEFKRKAMLGLL